MKKLLNTILATILLVSIFSSCKSDDALEGQGKVNLKLTINENIATFSRGAQEDSLAKKCTIYVYSSKGLIRKFHGIDELPAELWLVSGEYKAEAWSGDSVAASFDKKYYKGEAPFVISPAEAANAVIECKIANVVTSVTTDEEINSKLTDLKVTIANTKGSLDFKDDKLSSKGYFMMPSGDKNLSWTISGKQADGSLFTQSGTIQNVKPTTEYAMRLQYNQNYEEVGGAIINVTIDETLIEMPDNIEIVGAPKIFGVGFDIESPVFSEKGNFNKTSVWVSAASKLKNLILSCDKFISLGLPTSSFDFMQMTTAAKESIAELGIEDAYVYDDVEDRGSDKVSFSKEFLNKFEDGEYVINITATDNYGKTRTMPLRITVSNASVVTNSVERANIWAHHAVVSGDIAKEGVSGVGFNYREKGTSAWTKADGIISGNSFSATIPNLKGATTYQFVAVCDGFAGNDVKEFTTESLLQLKNASFEDWQTSSSPYLIYPSGGSMYWDSGNWGSATMDKNITTPDSNVKNSGQYSIKMTSQFVGVSIFGKFAAGNVFVGKYLKTDGTDGILGFGRSFTSRPKALKGYIRYNPVAVNYDNSEISDKINKGDMDNGIVYVALVDGTTMTSDGETWPQIIKTKKANRQLFDSSVNNTRIIAYGEKVWNSSTGEQLLEFTINLDYRDNRIPSYLILVASSSKYGDYFVGGDGSTMWLDDLEFVYD